MQDMHPAYAAEFVWDAENEGHLARHGITPSEVVQVFFNGPVWIPNRKDRAGDWKMVGWTNGRRALTVIIMVIPQTEAVRVITGWDAATGDVARYLSKRRGYR
jgi:uncharacterized DUF497 family protein